MVGRSDQRMERSALERSGHGTKWPKDGTKWFGTKWSWNEVTGYRLNGGLSLLRFGCLIGTVSQLDLAPSLTPNFWSA